MSDFLNKSVCSTYMLRDCNDATKRAKIDKQCPGKCSSVKRVEKFSNTDAGIAMGVILGIIVFFGIIKMIFFS